VDGGTAFLAEPPCNFCAGYWNEPLRARVNSEAVRALSLYRNRSRSAEFIPQAAFRRTEVRAPVRWATIGFKVPMGARGRTGFGNRTGGRQSSCGSQTSQIRAPLVAVSPRCAVSPTASRPSVRRQEIRGKAKRTSSTPDAGWQPAKQQARQPALRCPVQGPNACGKTMGRSLSPFPEHSNRRASLSRAKRRLGSPISAG